MRNLELFDLSRQAVQNVCEYADRIVYVENLVYVLKKGDLVVYNSKNQAVVATIILNCDRLTQFEYLAVEKLLWLGTGTEFMYINPTDNSLRKITHCFTISDEEPQPLVAFDSAVWNPTQDSIVIIKSTGELGLYVVDFEGGHLIEMGVSSLHNEIPQVEQLGWGSSERQFRCPEELALAASLNDEEPIVKEELNIPRVSWRGNGKNYAVNYCSNGKRKIKVFKYPCELEYQSEGIVGLQSVIAWKPVGNWIAGVIWTTKRCQLTIFEKNCLPRCNFDLTKNAYVRDLKWSPSGDVLAVHQSGAEEKESTIDLYTFKNYVAYLKQRVPFNHLNAVLQYEFLKSPNSICILNTITLYETITFSFKFVYHCSPSNTMCISIKGLQALVTRCKNGMIPPPSCEFTIDVTSPINFIAFHPEKTMVALIDSCNVVTIFEISDRGVENLGSLSFERLPILPLRFHHFLWGNNTKISCLGETSDASTSLIDLFVLDIDEDYSDWKFSVKMYVKKTINYVGLIENSRDFIEQKCNNILRIDSKRVEYPLFTLPSSPLHIRAILVDNKVYLFSLMTTNSFFINESEILQGVISFIIYKTYLFLTTVENKLIGVRLNKNALTEFSNLNFKHAYQRLIEQGSSLLCGIPNTSYIVMQTPRGNIEICTCRTISVDRIEALLKEQAWNEALDLVRREKLNTNVLVDLNFNRFIMNIEKFIEAVKIPSILSEFLLELEDQNVFNTVYSNCAISVPEEVPNKRTVICDAMIKYMEQNFYIHNISTIITACFVKNSPNCISEALQYVQSLLDCIENDKTVIHTAEEAFKSARALKSTGEMYEAALLTYDLDLVLFVARNMEMDPLEFEPFISDLRSLDEGRCRFKINSFLRRHFEALLYLIRCTKDENEILNYIKVNSIAKEALWILEPDTSLYVQVTHIFAGHLSKQNKNEEAASFYYRAGLFEEALDEYKCGLCWKQAINIMQKLNMPPNQQKENLQIMAQGLKRERRFEEASQIYEKYLGDYETAIELCMFTGAFSEAVRLAQKYNREDICESDIIERIREHSKFLREKFSLMKESFYKYKDRLNVVRTIKKSKLQNHINGLSIEQSDFIDADDIGSIAGASTITSVRTSSSHTSRKSSRSRRKEERKKYSMREGSIYEDIALMSALYELIHDTFQWGPRIRELCLTAITVGHSLQSDVIILYNVLSLLQQQMKESLKEIWPPNMNNCTLEPEDAAVFENVSQLDFKYRVPPDNTNVSWKLDDFPVINLEA